MYHIELNEFFYVPADLGDQPVKYLFNVSLQEDSDRKRREWERNFEEEINSLIREHSTKSSNFDTKILQSESKLQQVNSSRTYMIVIMAYLKSN